MPSFSVGFIALVQFFLDHTDVHGFPQERSLPSAMAVFAPEDIHFVCDAFV